MQKHTKLDGIFSLLRTKIGPLHQNDLRRHYKKTIITRSILFRSLVRREYNQNGHTIIVISLGICAMEMPSTRYLRCVKMARRKYIMDGYSIWEFWYHVTTNTGFEEFEWVKHGVLRSGHVTRMNEDDCANLEINIFHVRSLESNSSVTNQKFHFQVVDTSMKWCRNYKWRGVFRYTCRERK